MLTKGDIHVEVKFKELNPEYCSSLSKEETEKIAFDKMIKRFNRKVVKSGILERYRKKTYYEKKSLKKHHHTQEWQFKKEHSLLDKQEKKEII